MKRRMLRIFLIAALAGLALSGLYRHFVTDQIMDGGGGMENPDAVREDELQILDGDHTYVDNSALWPVLEGVWESGDGRWQAVIGEDSGIALTLDGEVREDELQLLDGGHTYVDNGALWEKISGAWSSGDGRWALTLGGDQEMTLTLDGDTVLSSALRFTYLQPGEVLHTELFPDDGTLTAPGGTALGEIESLCHEAGDGGSGVLIMTLELPEDPEETVTLQKQA